MAQPVEEPPLWRLALAKIQRDDIPLRASALGYSTIASLVPIMAIVLAILSGPAFKDNREDIIRGIAGRLVPDREQTNLDNETGATQEHIQDTFRETVVPLAERAGAVSVFGFVVLLITVWTLYRSVESSFNAIWGVRSERRMFLRLAIATSMIFWGPIMFALSISLSHALKDYPFVGTYIIPVAFSTTVFTSFFAIMPHANVRFSCALTAGIFVALMWELGKMGFLIYVSQVVGYYHVYGSLGLIPMLFLWVYLNWLMILAGAEVAYILQHRGAMVEQWKAAQKSPELSNCPEAGTVPAPVLILAAAIAVAKKFQAGEAGGARVSEVARLLNIETSAARFGLEQLERGKVLARVATNGQNSPSNSDDPAFVPAADSRAMNLASVFALTYSTQTIVGDGAEWERARKLMEQFGARGKEYFETMTLAELSAAELSQSENPISKIQDPK